MLVLDPKIFIQKDANTAGETLVNMQKTSMAFLLAHQNYQLTDELATQIAEYIEEICGVIVHPVRVKEIFNLYPHERITIARYGLQDTTEKESVSFVVANYFGSTSWPVFGDNLDINLFVDRIQQYAVAMGYSLSKIVDVNSL